MTAVPFCRFGYLQGIFQFICSRSLSFGASQGMCDIADRKRCSPASTTHLTILAAMKLKFVPNKESGDKDDKGRATGAYILYWHVRYIA